MRDLGRYQAFSACFDVHADEPAASELYEYLTDIRATGGIRPPSDAPLLSVHHDAGTWAVAWDGWHRYQGADLRLAIYDTLIAINLYAAGVAARDGMTVLHGGAVDIGGRAVAFVGHSGAGKSTFTAAMSRAGHAYLADEVVAIDGLVVQPFHRPVGLRSGGADRIGVDLSDGADTPVHPYRVGANGVLGGATPLAAVVLLRRSDNRTEPPRLERIGQAQALFELANQTLGATDLERSMFHRLDRLVRQAPVHQLHYTDLIAAIGLVEALDLDPPDVPDRGEV